MSSNSPIRDDSPTEPLYFTSGSTYTVVSGTKPEEEPRWSLEDRGYPATRYISVIEKDHPLVAIWDSTLGDKVMEIVRSGDDWRAVNVLRRGWSIVNNPPVIFIIVAKEASSPEWRSRAAAIYKMCVSENCPEVQVHVEVGKTFRGSALQRPYSSQPTLGSSIGLDVSGTLGGYLELRKKEQSKVVGFTCHHVLLPQPPDGSKPSGIFQTGLFPASGYAIMVHQPSDDNHKDSETETQKYISEMEEWIAEDEAAVEAGLASSVTLRALPIRKAKLAEQKAVAAEVQAFSRQFGKVFATSGYRRASRGCCLDWGLIEVDMKRIGQNKLQSIPQDVTFSSISETTKMKIGDRGIKFGRTTGYTTGVFNTIKTHCMLPCSDGESVEWCFLGNKCDFSREGDSGSFVLSSRGKLGGVIIGGAMDNYNLLAYVTPIDEVFQDIEQRLGYTVHLPETDEF